MALIVVFHNDGTGPDQAANYDVTVYVGDGSLKSRRIYDGRVEGHDRQIGWEALVKRLADVLEPDGNKHR